MHIAEMKKHKVQLEKDIENKLMRFADVTGCRLDGIYLDINTAYNTDGEPAYFGVRVEIEVKL